MSTPGLRTNHPWDGTYEDGDLPRPGFKRRASYTIQPGERDAAERFVWGVFSHRAMTLLATGVTDTVDEARAQVMRVFEPTL